MKVSGRKDELAARLVESASPDLLSKLAKTKIWACSDAALEIVKEHRDGKKILLDGARLQSLELLRLNLLKEACDLVCKYEQKQFFPRGIGVDWHNGSGAIYQELTAVYAAQTKFHARRFGAISSEMRERAAMSVLWGTSAFGDLFTKAELPEQAEQIELFSRMLGSHAAYLRDLKQMKKVAADGLNLKCEIIAAQGKNTTCDACLGDDGKLYLVSDVPELPHEFCKCSRGCRCVLGCVVDTDTIIARTLREARPDLYQ